MKALFSEAYGYTKYVVVQGGATDMVAKFSNTDTSGAELSPSISPSLNPTKVSTAHQDLINRTDLDIQPTHNEGFAGALP